MSDSTKIEGEQSSQGSKPKLSLSAGANVFVPKSASVPFLYFMLRDYLFLI